MPEMITLTNLALELNLDKSGLRKYILKNGFAFTQIRDSISHQVSLALSREDADSVIEMRKSQGFSNENAVVQNGNGFFYVIQLVPELDERRVKLGFATNVEARLEAHKTTSPTAILIKHWTCQKSWELAAIASLTRIECKCIGSEVFQCENIKNLVKRGDMFFALFA